jgi:hypothetical protein
VKSKQAATVKKITSVIEQTKFSVCCLLRLLHPLAPVSESNNFLIKNWWF